MHNKKFSIIRVVVVIRLTHSSILEWYVNPINSLFYKTLCSLIPTFMDKK